MSKEWIWLKTDRTSNGTKPGKKYNMVANLPETLFYWQKPCVQKSSYPVYLSPTNGAKEGMEDIAQIEYSKDGRENTTLYFFLWLWWYSTIELFLRCHSELPRSRGPGWHLHCNHGGVFPQPLGCLEVVTIIAETPDHPQSWSVLRHPLRLLETVRYSILWTSNTWRFFILSQRSASLYVFALNSPAWLFCQIYDCFPQQQRNTLRSISRAFWTRTKRANKILVSFEYFTDNEESFQNAPLHSHTIAYI